MIADPGDTLFGAQDLYIDGTHFSRRLLLLARFCGAGGRLRDGGGAAFVLLVLAGDGAFQKTGMELSTIARYGMNPVVNIFDNDGYGTELPMLGGAFNDAHNWR